jgi:hypothetical protein
LSTFAQQQLTVRFDLENSEGATDESILKINQLRYYISSIQLLKGDKVVYLETDSYHLIDHTDEPSNLLEFSLPAGTDFDAISFNIGVDSAKNMAGVHGGDLDPTKGMYWTWQSGYINFKLEAELSDHELSYHIGGFMYPNNACRNVTLSTEEAEEITIIIEPAKLLAEIDYVRINHVMSPGETAMYLADLLPTLFSIR